MHYYESTDFNDNLIIVNKKIEKYLPESIFGWFNGCSAIITGASTSGNEALLVGLPVITIDFNNELNDLDFIKNKVSLHATCYDELKKALNKVIQKDLEVDLIMKKSTKYLKNYYYKMMEKQVKE